MANNQTDNFIVGQQLALDGKYMNGYIPYTDIAQVMSIVKIGKRVAGLTVNIAGVEYWWPPDTTDLSIEPIIKQQGGGGAGLNFWDATKAANGDYKEDDVVLYGNPTIGYTFWANTVDGNTANPTANNSDWILPNATKFLRLNGSGQVVVGSISFATGITVSNFTLGYAPIDAVLGLNGVGAPSSYIMLFDAATFNLRKYPSTILTGAVWGNVSGDIADQTDLQAIIDSLAQSVSDEATRATGAEAQIISDAENYTDAEVAAFSEAIVTQLVDAAGTGYNNFKKIEDKLVALTALLASDDVSLDTIQEIVEYIKENESDISSLLSGKANISDIYNALDYTIAGKFLDARQGKALKDLVDALAAVVAGKQNTLTFDSTPTLGSTNPVTSGGVKVALDNEATRAGAAEGTIVSNLNSEISRAESAEATLQTSINFESNRAVAEEGNLQTALDNETDRAANAEAAIASDLADEISNRGTAEATLSAAIAAVYTDLRSGVVSAGDTLQKLYNLIIGASSEEVVANITARNAYNIPHLPFNLFVTDDGDGKWAIYKATSTGVGATFVKINDQDSLTNAISNSAIAAAYESYADVNRFTTAFLNKLNGIAAGATANATDAYLLARGNQTGTQLASTISDFAAAALLAAPAEVVPSDAETQAGLDNTKMLTPLRVANLWTYLKTQAQTFTDYITAKGFKVSGTGGNGYVELPSQSSVPATPSSGFMRVFADATGRFGWITVLGFSRIFKSTTLTANREYTLQDRHGVLADDTDLATKVDKVSGKGLSTNDYDNTEKAQVSTNTSAIATEASTRGSADTTLQNNINAEANTRSNADTAEAAARAAADVLLAAQISALQQSAGPDLYLYNNYQ